MRVMLMGTYEMGRQPFGLASPAAWIRQAGATVVCQDLSRSRLDKDEVRRADVIAFYVPMHTATRIAVHMVQHVKTLNPQAHLCFYGLYAPMDADFLRQIGIDTILGGEFETALVQLIYRLQNSQTQLGRQHEPLISLDRQQFLVPDRQDLPPPEAYTRLVVNEQEKRLVGYTEASRGCKHLCRHCPIVPVYAGRFRIVQQDVVLADIRQQVAAGVEHITFGDPDFFNGVGHAMRLVQDLHEQFPQLTYDVTIKIEHILRYARHLPTLRDTGCILITSAVEAVQDHILQLLDKGHTYQDFLTVLTLCRELGMHLNPTFVAFMPWITLIDYLQLLTVVTTHDLIDYVSPIQLAMRLLLPAGSALLELPAMKPFLTAFDASALTYHWRHPDDRMEQLSGEALQIVQSGESEGVSRREIFTRLWTAAHKIADLPVPSIPAAVTMTRGPQPYLNEPWYC